MSWVIKGILGMGWSIYAFASLFLFYLLIFENQEKGNIPLVLFVRNIPFLVLYGMFVWKQYSYFEKGRLFTQTMFLLLSLFMWGVWGTAMYFDGMYTDYETSCQFLTHRLFL